MRGEGSRGGAFMFVVCLVWRAPSLFRNAAITVLGAHANAPLVADAPTRPPPRSVIPLCLRHRLRKDPLADIDSGDKVRLGLFVCERVMCSAARAPAGQSTRRQSTLMPAPTHQCAPSPPAPPRCARCSRASSAWSERGRLSGEPG